MRRRLLTAVLIAVVSSLATLATVRAAATEDCACVKAKCCCAPKRAASGSHCHGLEADDHDAAMRCHHSTDTIALTSTIGALPSPAALRPAAFRAMAWDAARPAPREGFSMRYAPPPRPLAS